MQRKRSIKIIFLLLTVVNLVIFYFRDHFQYQPYKSEKDLYASCDADCENKWKKFVSDFPEEELEQGKKISDSVLSPSSANTKEKLLRLSGFLFLKFRNQLGEPTEELLVSSPYNQYKKLAADSSTQLWCGNLAQMFAWMCWSQGIVCRVVEIMKPGDRHVVNECYLPETKQWVLVDITNGQLLVSKDEKFLNLLSFKKTLKTENPEIIFHPGQKFTDSNLLSPSSAYILKYYLPDYPVYYYHSVDNKKAYSTNNKIKAYFLPVSWYEIWDPANKGNLAFYLKEVFIFLWLISFFVFMVSRTKFRI
jgi:hypothetical protein